MSAGGTVIGAESRDGSAAEGSRPRRVSRVRKQVAGPDQPARHGPHGHAEDRGRLLVGLPLEVAEDHGGAERVGEPAQFLVERGPQLVVAIVGRPDRRGASLSSAPPGPVGGRRSSGPPSPCGRRRHRASWRADSRRAIERAFRARTRNVTWKASSASSGSARIRRQTAQHHRPVPLDDRREGDPRRPRRDGRGIARGAARRSVPRSSRGGTGSRVPWRRSWTLRVS